MIDIILYVFKVNFIINIMSAQLWLTTVFDPVNNVKIT